MKRQHTPANFCKEDALTRVLVRRTIVLGTEHGRLPTVLPPMAAGAQTVPAPAPPMPMSVAVANPGALTLRIGSPEPSFPLTRDRLVIPMVPPAAGLDAEDLIRTTLRVPQAASSQSDPDDLLATCVRQPAADRVEDPEDLLQTRLLPSGPSRAKLEDLNAPRIEPHEFLDTVALRELTLPPEVEARLPPPPPPGRKPKHEPRRQPPPLLRATGRNAARAAQRHVLSRTIKHAQTQPLDPNAAPRQRGLYARWLVRRPTTVLRPVSRQRSGTAWLWAAALGACSMVLAYALTDHLVSTQKPEPSAVLRELTPTTAGASALTLSAGASAR